MKINISAMDTECLMYVSDSSAAAIESLTADCWTTLLQAGCLLQTYDLDDAGEADFDSHVSITHDSLDSIRQARITDWTEGTIDADVTKCNGFSAVRFANVQRAVGQQRQDVLVVDLGDVRLCLSNREF